MQIRTVNDAVLGKLEETNLVNLGCDFQQVNAPEQVHNKLAAEHG